jgi:hypothetical protein
MLAKLKLLGHVEGKNWGIALLLLALVLVLRFLPHPANFSPTTAAMFLAPFAIRQKWIAILVTGFAILLSDLKLGIYPGISFVYLSYFVIAALGLFQLHLQKGIGSTALKSFGFGINVLAGATAFFVISNLGVFFFGGLYPQTLEGFIECFVLAIPFFHKTLLAHIIYSVALIGLFVTAHAAVRAKLKSPQV